MGVAGSLNGPMLILNAIRIELGKLYRGTIDLLSEMPGITEEIGLTKIPHSTVLCIWFGRIPVKTWRAFLGRSAGKRTGHAAIDATGFDRDQPSRMSKRCTPPTSAARQRNTTRRLVRRSSAGMQPT